MGTTTDDGWADRFFSVHPHGRGDNDLHIRESGSWPGSPPRAWGQPYRGPFGHLALRFTPTGVGTTAKQIGEQGLNPVHPHGRGDNAVLIGGWEAVIGSPPRAWGQLAGLFGESLSNRFTPTGVGTTNPAAIKRASPSVHPHGRGDNVFSVSLTPSTNGSPPRAWGQPGEGRQDSGRLRFTPTGVGTTSAGTSGRRPYPVHPHGRGDNLTAFIVDAGDSGSPPRAWGQLIIIWWRRLLLRFTPTGVGTTVTRRSPQPPAPVHPHGRGDNSPNQNRIGWKFGSPPRAWGQLGQGLARPGSGRFTPTGVGTTLVSRPIIPELPVHPHGRGDN